MYGIFKQLVQYVYNTCTCTVLAKYMYGAFIKHVQCLHNLLAYVQPVQYNTVPIYCMYSACTIQLYMNTACTIKYIACTIHVQCLHIACTVPTQYLYMHSACSIQYSACTIHVKCLHNACTVPKHYLFMYSACIIQYSACTNTIHVQ